MARNTQPVETVKAYANSKEGETKEVHPAWGLARVSRHTQTPGAVLFDSEIRHNSTVVLTIAEGSRQRDLNSDWFFGGREIIEIEMSEAQWGALVSSFFGEGRGSTPVTIRYAPEDRFPCEHVPGLEFET